MHYELTDRFIVKADLAETWAFFSSADNLPQITPPWLSFRNVSVPDAIALDARLDYTIRWLGLPVRWRTLIVDWSPPRQFVDLQLRGPYSLWHHTHRFTPADGGGTACEDRVLYRLPFGPVGRLAHRLVVRRQLLDIFEYRRRVITENLGWIRAIQATVEVRPVG